ncbi:MAG: VirD4-like conjugal transfer protein, CD1115 family [Bacilli bacterium]
MNKKYKNFIIITVITVITFIFNYYLIHNNTTYSKITSIPILYKIFLFGIPAIMIIFMYAITLPTTKNKKITRMNTGQFGDARFLEETEKKTILEEVVLCGNKTKWTPGVVISSEESSFLIDSSDKNIILVAPPGTGKTKRFLIPTLQINALVKNENKKSLLITDVKGELFESTSQNLKDNGYNVIAFNFRNPLESNMFNMMAIINKYIDRSNNATSTHDVLFYFATAEKNAKILAELIVGEEKNQSGNSKYFRDTAVGLLISVILLVSKYSKPNERHIISVLNIVIDLNGLIEGSTDVIQKNKYAELIRKLDEAGENEIAERLKMYSGASISADNRTSMNIFSSTIANLTRFIDQEMEQMISAERSEFDSETFIKEPTAVFMIIPDDNTTRHFLASLLIRNFTNELILIAEKSGGILEREVEFLLDEFGNTPEIKDFDVISTAVRGRRIRITIALQSEDQLERIYGKEKAKIIKKAFQTVIYGTLSTSAIDEAKKISESAGTYTATTFSTSSGDNANFFSILPNSKNKSSSEQLIKKNLIEPFELFTMPSGSFIVFPHGSYPFKTHLEIIYDILDNKKYPINKLKKMELPRTHLKQVQKLNEPKLFANIFELNLSKKVIEENVFEYNNKEFI